MERDPLSSILDRSGVEGSIFCRAELGAPWAVSTKGSLGEDRPAIFHVIVRGEGHVTVRPDREGVAWGREPLAWTAGDVILMPHGDPHLMWSGDAPETPISTLSSPPGHDGLPCLVHGGDGELTSLLCGTVRFQEDAAELLRPQLPPLLHLRCDEGPAAAWLDATLRLLGTEANSALPGAESVVARLAEVLFVQALRAWIHDAEQQQSGWLAALADPELARVLGLIHEQPASPWTAASLARRAGLSRSVLYARFTDVIGEPPASYLTRWRMHIARKVLRKGATLAEAAEQVGYNSDAAFSRAFKRIVGVNPGAWRDTQHAAAGA